MIFILGWLVDIFIFSVLVPLVFFQHVLCKLFFKRSWMDEVKVEQ
jgi:hypothetical protein